MPLTSQHNSTIMAKEGDYEHVGTFHYKEQEHHAHHHHHHHHHDDCVAECDQSSECEGVCTSQSSCCSFNPSQQVVKAEVVHGNDTHHSEGLPSVQLSAAAAIVDVPALRLSLLERSGAFSSAATASRSNAEQEDNLEEEGSVGSRYSEASSLAEAACCVPVVIATPLQVEEQSVHTSSSCMYETGNAWNRPQFLSATVVRESTDQKFGIKFHCVDPNKNNLSSWNYSQRLFRRRRGSRQKKQDPTVQDEFPLISEVHKNSNGLLSQAPFCVGDQLISINKESCRGMPPSVFAERLATLQGVITFVVQHPGGDSTLVESFLRKPTPASKTGVGLVYSPRHNRLRVKHVHFAGLMVEGLLQVEDRIVAINHIPCQHWDAQTAADQIALSPYWVSIVARRHRDAAVVLTVSEAEQETGLCGISSKDSVRDLLRSLHHSSHSGENVCISPRSSLSSSRGLGFLSRRRRTRRLRHAVSF